jgi:hypothetical protein
MNSSLASAESFKIHTQSTEYTESVFRLERYIFRVQYLSPLLLSICLLVTTLRGSSVVELTPSNVLSFILIYGGEGGGFRLEKNSNSSEI